MLVAGQQSLRQTYILSQGAVRDQLIPLSEIEQVLSFNAVPGESGLRGSAFRCPVLPERIPGRDSPGDIPHAPRGRYVI